MSRSVSSSALQLPAGSLLEHYELSETLGAGSFGVTYRAHTRRFKADCVIKELLPVDFATRAANRTEVVPLQECYQQDLAKCRQDFEREAMVLQKVNHPNVVKILDFFEANRTSYMVMPYAEGCDYEAHLQQLGRPPTEEEMLRLLIPALDGLGTVHQLGYLHRDLKPQNLLLMKNGAPLIIDFGAARLAIGSRSRQISTILTPKYAPFEQYSTTMDQGPYTDIYSMAAVVHRAMTGEAPIEAPNRMSPTRPDPYVPLAERLRGQYSPHLLEATDWALRRGADDRPQSVADWRRCLPIQPPLELEPDVIGAEALPPPPPIDAPPLVRAKSAVRSLPPPAAYVPMSLPPTVIAPPPSPSVSPAAASGCNPLLTVVLIVASIAILSVVIFAVLSALQD